MNLLNCTEDNICFFRNYMLNVWIRIYISTVPVLEEFIQITYLNYKHTFLFNL